MSLLKNFVNPWGLGTGVLDTGVLDTDVLKTDVLGLENITSEKISSLIYTEEGTFLGHVAPNIEKAEVFIMDKNTYNVHTKNNTKLIPYDKVKELDRYGRNPFTGKYEAGRFLEVIDDAQIFSKILTHILKKSGFDTSILLNGKISILGKPTRPGFSGVHNNPESGVGYANTSYPGTYPGPGSEKAVRITANIVRMSDPDHISFVANIISALGVHELQGHGINRWDDKNKKHHKVYELQFNHSSWKQTTDNFKAHMVENYIQYIFDEKGRDYAQQKINEKKQQYGKNSSFDAYMWKIETYEKY